MKTRVKITLFHNDLMLDDYMERDDILFETLRDDKHPHEEVNLYLKVDTSESLEQIHNAVLNFMESNEIESVNYVYYANGFRDICFMDSCLYKEEDMVHMTRYGKANGRIEDKWEEILNDENFIIE